MLFILELASLPPSFSSSEETNCITHNGNNQSNIHFLNFATSNPPLPALCRLFLFVTSNMKMALEKAPEKEQRQHLA